MPLFLSGTIADQQRIWPLDGPQFGIGRSSKNAIHLPDGTVSKDHAEIVQRGERWYLRDLGSRNGTRVNGVEAKEPIAIAVGDRVEIGHVQLAVSDREPSQQVRYSDATVLGSSLKIRADQILDRREPTGSTAGKMVHLLAEAGRLLVLPRPMRETCEELLAFVERAVPASRYVLLLREKEGAEPEQIAARTRKGRVSEPLALSRSIMNSVLDDCTSVVTGDAASDARFQGQQSIVAQAVRSAMAVPLFDNERVLGLLYVDSQDLMVRFGEDQLELLTLLANMAAVKITNARLLEQEQARARMVQELATATRIQRGLLPVAPPQIAGWAFDAYLETCYEVGGDLFDFHVADDGRVFFVLGDVTGKGMGAALLMSSFLSSARVLYDDCADLGVLATRLGDIVYRSTDPIHYVTGFVGWLDPATGALHYVNAGHPSPLIVRGTALRALESTGVPFGILPGFKYQAATTTLEPGETLSVFSDGVPEAAHGETFFEEDQLKEILLADGAAPLAEVRDRIVGAVRAFVGDSPRSDDITLVMVRRLPTAV